MQARQPVGIEHLWNLSLARCLRFRARALRGLGMFAGFYLASFVFPATSPLAATAPSPACLSGISISCYEPDTLVLRWRIEDGIGSGGRSLLAIRADTLVVNRGAAVARLDVLNGAIRWRQWFSSRTFMPVVGSDRIFVATVAGDLVALDLSSGRRFWTRRFASWVYPPAISSSLLVVTGRDRVVRGVGPVDGFDHWILRLDQEPVYAPLELGGGRSVAVSTFSGAVYRIAAADGSLEWIADLGEPSRFLRDTGAVVVVALMGGDLVALAVDNGSVEWRSENVNADSLVYLAATRTLIATSGARLIVLDVGDGSVRDLHDLPSEPLSVAALDGSSVALVFHDVIRAEDTITRFSP